MDGIAIGRDTQDKINYCRGVLEEQFGKERAQEVFSTENDEILDADLEALIDGMSSTLEDYK